MLSTAGDDEEAEPNWLASLPSSPPLVSPVPSFSSDIPASYNNNEESSVPPTPVRTKSDAEEEPAWLSDATRRVSDFHGGYEMEATDEENSNSPDAASRQATTVMPDVMNSDASLPTSAAFSRAVNASSAAFAEFRSLSAQELSEGLLSLSVSCTRSMRTSTQAGLAATSRFAREMYTAAVVTAPPPGETRLQSSLVVLQGHWRELMHIPTAGLFAACALMNAVFAMMLTFLQYTPLAARQFASYVQTNALEYHTEYTNHRLREARRAPAAGRPQQVVVVEESKQAATGEDAV